MSDNVRMVVGLEVHVQLKTESKLFCGCSTRFGAEPNTQTCPVCLGLPGSLPVLNRKAIELSIKTGLALNCEIPPQTKWDRKNYFYPDLPKGYQISQFDLPITQDGFLEISDGKNRFEPKRVGIIRAHLEEDAGKSMHDESGGSASSRIDLNRTGTPLLEIVSHPDMNSPLEARAYLNELKLLLTFLEVSDCNMQEGSLRVDANINLHIDIGEKTIATPIVEVKNMNSFRAVERALEHEGERQLALWKETGQTIDDAPKETRGWDDPKQATFAQRTKEESSDYRYFPDPDLVPVNIDSEQVDAIRASLPETPAQRRARFAEAYKLSDYDAEVIVNQGRELADYFEELVESTGDAKRSANWMQQEVMRVLNEKQIEIADFSIPVDRLSELVAAVASGKLDNSRAKDVFQEMLESGIGLQQAKETLGIVEVDASELDELCAALIEENPAAVEDIRGGKQQAIGALIGQARKRNANVNPGDIRKRLLELIQD